MKIRSKDQKKTKVNDLIKFLNGLKLKRRYKWLKKMKFYKVPKKKHHFDIKLKGSDYLIYPGYTPLATVIFYRNRIPTICRNIAGVINTNQQPDLLHYIYFRNDDETKNRHKTNRSNAIRTHQGKDLGPLSYNPAGSGQSWDEYPFASTYESETRRVNVWRVPEGENWSQGGTLGPFYKNTLHRRDGALFNVRIEDAPDN